MIIFCNKRNNNMIVYSYYYHNILFVDSLLLPNTNTHTHTRVNRRKQKHNKIQVSDGHFYVYYCHYKIYYLAGMKKTTLNMNCFNF